MTLKVGDKVKIKRKEECIEADNKYYETESIPGFNELMYKYCGKNFTITSIKINSRGFDVYRLEGNTFWWSAHYFRKLDNILNIL